MIRRSEKSCKEGIGSIQCFPLTTRCCACFSDYAHSFRIQGCLNPGYVLSGHCSRQQFSVKNEGVLIFEVVLSYGVLRYYGYMRANACTNSDRTRKATDWICPSKHLGEQTFKTHSTITNSSPSAPAHFFVKDDVSTRIALVFVRSKWTKWNQPDLCVLLVSR